MCRISLVYSCTFYITSKIFSTSFKSLILLSPPIIVSSWISSTLQKKIRIIRWQLSYFLWLFYDFHQFYTSFWWFLYYFLFPQFLTLSKNSFTTRLMICHVYCLNSHLAYIFIINFPKAVLLLSFYQLINDSQSDPSTNSLLDSQECLSLSPSFFSFLTPLQKKIICTSSSFFFCDLYFLISPVFLFLLHT